MKRALTVPRREPLLPLKPKCTKGVACGSVCISKGEKCHAEEFASEFYDDSREYARGFHEYTAAVLSGFEHPRTGKVDIANFRLLPEARQRAALREAHRFVENGLVDGTGIDKYHERAVDSLLAGYEREYPQGMRSPVYVKTKRRRDSMTRLNRKHSGKCGRGWEPAPGGKCVRKNRGKAFRRALWNTSAALGAVTASSVATRIGAGLVARGVRKVKQFQSQPQPSVRRDAPPRAKCDKDHGWTRGAGSCIRKKRNRAAIKGAAKTALVAAKSVTGAIVGAAAAGTLMGGTIAGRKLRDSVRSRVRGQVSKDRKDLLHEKSK